MLTLIEEVICARMFVLLHFFIYILAVHSTSPRGMAMEGFGEAQPGLGELRLHMVACNAPMQA